MAIRQKRVHFIAIGGAAMHNLALELHSKGAIVTGSDDDIFSPSKERLEEQGLLPSEKGWFPEKITPNLDFVILGMHAKADNPELLKAQELNIPVYSFPEFIYEHSKNKQRVVIAGSHGKTSITSIIIHVLEFAKKPFDFLVGAQIEGFQNMVRLSDDAPVIVIEGDEYLTSPIDRVPKFLKYKHHIALVSGIAWDHANVFPTLENYVRQFDHLADSTPKAGVLIFNDDDPLADVVCKKEREDVIAEDYKVHPHEIVNGETFLITPDKKKIKVAIFGQHNMSNIAGAKAVVHRLGITDDVFYEAISSFKGAAKRLELIKKGNSGNALFRDFAHAPSKVKATVKAVVEQYPTKELLAVFELHTFSSLSREFLPQYAGTLKKAHHAIVYYDPEVVSKKGLAEFSTSEIQTYFDQPLNMVANKDELQSLVDAAWAEGKNILLMSSGNFSGLTF